MTRTLLAVALGALVAPAAFGQTKTYALDSADDLELHNVQAEAASFKGREGLRLSISDDAARRLEAMRARQQRAGKKAQKKGAGGEGGRLELIAVVEGLEFSNGTIEAEIAGSPAPGAAGGARGFVGIAFRVREERTVTTPSTCARPTAAPRTKSAATTRRSTSRTPTGPGSVFATRPRAATRPTSTSCPTSGSR